MLREFLVGLEIGIIVSIPLGPMAMLCVQRTLSKGRRYGFATGVGAALSDALYAGIAAYSLSFIIDFVNKYKFAMLIFVSLLLFAFGLHTFLNNPVKQLRSKHDNSSKSGKIWSNFITSFMLTFSNPLTFLILLTVFAQVKIIPTENTKLATGILIGGIFLGACLWWWILTWVVGIFKRYVNVRNLWWLNRISGTVIMIAAFYILLDTLFPTLFTFW